MAPGTSLLELFWNIHSGLISEYPRSNCTFCNTNIYFKLMFLLDKEMYWPLLESWPISISIRKVESKTIKYYLAGCRVSMPSQRLYLNARHSCSEA